MQRLTESQKILITREARQSRTIKELSKLANFDNQKIVLAFCQKYELPFKTRWEEKQERKRAFRSGTFNVDASENWLIGK